jgi:hypothetical protein
VQVPGTDRTASAAGPLGTVGTGRPSRRVRRSPRACEKRALRDVRRALWDRRQASRLLECLRQPQCALHGAGRARLVWSDK